ncbi:MAG: DEAD/DEAH box helicase [Planctomycetota bacterium]
MPSLCGSGAVLEIALLKFEDLNLSPRLLETLVAEGYETPTPIQARAIPPALEGRDVLGCAQTGTGKTAAFGLPLIDRLVSERPNTKQKRGARALVLAPTRELASQIEDAMRTYGRGTGLRAVVIYGGVKQSGQVRQLRAGVDVIVATPGRLLDLIDQGHVDLGSIEVFVLDEADRMLDMGFIDPIRKIGRQLPDGCQTLFFSATMPPKIRELADSMLYEPVSVAVNAVASAAPLIEQSLYHVAGENKPGLLTHLLQDAKVERAVVFTRTKYGADKLTKTLTRANVSAGAIHGNKTQSQRERALDAFRAGRARVLVATDVAARGLDVDGITHVFNFNLPNEPEAYVHRIGRTGRAGETGMAVSFCAKDERGYLRAIERLIDDRIDTVRVPEMLGVEDETPALTQKKAPRTRDGAERKGRKPRRKSGGGPVGDVGASKTRRRAGTNTGSKRGAKADAGEDKTRRKGGARSNSKAASKPVSKKSRRKSSGASGEGATRPGVGAGGRGHGPRRASARSA